MHGAVVVLHFVAEGGVGEVSFKIGRPGSIKGIENFRRQMSKGDGGLEN